MHSSLSMHGFCIDDIDTADFSASPISNLVYYFETKLDMRC